MTALPDIPRLYTALAECLAVLLFTPALAPRFSKAVTGGITLLWAAVLSAFLELTGNVPGGLWIPCMVTAIGLSYFLLLGIRNSAAGYAFLIPGAAMLLLLPEIYTYRCRVTADSVTVSLRIVFYPYRKEVQWTDVAYKRVKRGKSGAILSLRLYDAQKKRLLSVDALVVGIERMVKRVRNVPKLEK